MKKFLFVLTALLIIAGGSPVMAGGGQKVTERRNVTGFERILLKGSPEIKYTQGSQFSVRVKAPQRMIKDVITRVEGNKLVVSIKNSQWLIHFGKFDNDVEVYVTSPDLIGVELVGSGDFECKGPLDTDNLSVVLKGSGDIEFRDIICDRLKASVVGSGDLEIGKMVALQSDIELVGSGDITIGQQRVKQTRTELKGSGGIKLSLKDCGIVNCRLMGSGDITLQGDAVKLNSTKRGSGEIHTKGLRTKK